MEIKKICALCGREFTADRRNAKYCSKECYKENHNEEKRKAWAESRAKRLAEKPKIETVKDCKHKDCAYKSKMSNRAIETCDYCLITKMPRGCKISECDKYKPKGAKR